MFSTLDFYLTFVNPKTWGTGHPDDLDNFFDLCITSVENNYFFKEDEFKNKLKENISVTWEKFDKKQIEDLYYKYEFLTSFMKHYIKRQMKNFENS